MTVFSMLHLHHCRRQRRLPRKDGNDLIDLVNKAYMIRLQNQWLAIVVVSKLIVAYSYKQTSPFWGFISSRFVIEIEEVRIKKERRIYIRKKKKKPLVASLGILEKWEWERFRGFSFWTICRAGYHWWEIVS